MQQDIVSVNGAHIDSIYQARCSIAMLQSGVKEGYQLGPSNLGPQNACPTNDMLFLFRMEKRCKIILLVSKN